MLKEYKSILIVSLHCILLSTSSHVLAELSDDKYKQAIRLLEVNAIQYDDIYNITRYMSYKKGGGLISVQQLYKDLPIFDSEITFHFDSDNKAVRNTDDSIYKVGNEINVGDIEVDIEPVISGVQAAEIAIGYSSNLDDADCLVNDRKRAIMLGIYKPVDAKQLYLAWQSTCKYRQTPSIMIDAKTGQILRSLNSGEAPIHTKQPIDFGFVLPEQNN